MNSQILTSYLLKDKPTKDQLIEAFMTLLGSYHLPSEADQRQLRMEIMDILALGEKDRDLSGQDPA